MCVCMALVRAKKCISNLISSVEGLRSAVQAFLCCSCCNSLDVVYLFFSYANLASLQSRGGIIKVYLNRLETLTYNVEIVRGFIKV